MQKHDVTCSARNQVPIKLEGVWPLVEEIFFPYCLAFVQLSSSDDYVTVAKQNLTFKYQGRQKSNFTQMLPWKNFKVFHA